MDAGQLVRSERIPQASLPDGLDPNSRWFEHEPIPFPSYPFEWPAVMLEEAGSLTLHLAESALQDGFGIKDATPHNVLFRGSQAVFVDVLSFEQRDPRDQVWMAYGQFARTFLLPLAAERYAGIPAHQTLAAHRDGLEPEQLYNSLGVLRRLMPPLLGLVSIPKWLGAGSQNPGKPAATENTEKADPEKARFVLRGLLRSCGKQLRRLAPAGGADSKWSGYLDHKSLYSLAQLAQKETFVRRALETAVPRTALDVGANEGHFSLLAEHAGARVVAIDSDPAVVGALYRRARAGNADVLPLVVDLARPTPAVGWRNQECPSFLDRARGQFDLVMMLAVIHHMLVSERIPLDHVLSVAAELSRDYVLIEYVAPQDPMFQKIARWRDRLYAHLTREYFESVAERRFELVEREQITGMDRWLYLYRRR
jgi:SAM-dependent methyltransferase